MNLNSLDPVYDMVVVGGGVTGAGVFSRAVAMGYRVLLVDARDFAWGTSSRSSKMVHGGLRYLKQGKLFLTRASVKERERLLATYPGLVTPLHFLMPIYKRQGPSKATMMFGLSLYSLMAGARQHQAWDRAGTLDLVPWLDRPELTGAVGFRDAQVDDARLVLRLIFDARDRGGHAASYTRAETLGRSQKGEVRAVALKDTLTGETREIRTRAVINATGVFAETLHPSPVKGFHIRPLRGSHLIFPGNSFSLDRVVSFLHPRDQRPVFIFPWQGTQVLGTTDVDHSHPLHADGEPGISREEAAYLLEGFAHTFPKFSLTMSDAVSAIAGIRPVLSRGKKSASGESREHVVWKDKGLVTVTGGKLTTFSLLARDAIRAAASWLPAVPAKPAPIDNPQPSQDLACVCPDAQTAQILAGRYGTRAKDLVPLMRQKNAGQIPGTSTLWAELIHGAAREEIRSLADLMLRRVRIGLLLPRGGMDLMDKIRERTAPVLGWDHDRWKEEISDYEEIWRQAHDPKRAR